MCNNDPVDDGSFAIGTCHGLEQLEEIYLESPPELNSGLLMQILNNKESKALKLRKLDLRFCPVDLQTIANLVQQEVKTLKSFTLLIGYKNQHEYLDYGFQHPPQKAFHLCPLLRQFSKNLVYLKFAAPYICSELIFDNLEIECIRQNGMPNNTSLDKHAIHQTIADFRRKKSLSFRNSCVADAIAQARIESSSSPGSMIKVNTEVELDREEQKRARLIQESNPSWQRSIISWNGLCHKTDGWAELQEAANMDEEGMEWTLTDTFYSCG